MRNQEVVMEELKKLPNLDGRVYVTENPFIKETFTVCVEGQKYGIGGGKLLDLVHGIRAMKQAGIEGTVENIEKGLRVFSMLTCIYTYDTRIPQEMVESAVFKDKLYDLDTNVILSMAEYLIENVDGVQENVYTDCEGCSYNSMALKDIDLV